MAKSAILTVKIIGDGSGASKAMAGTARSASSMAARFGAVSGAVAGVVGSMTSKVVGYVSNLSGEMADTSDSAQAFANTLSFADVDDSTIKRLTKSTQVYADQTVFSLSDIRNTTAQLASNGVKDYDQLAEAAGNLTAVAGGGADAYKSVAMVLTQTAGAGKLTAENWNQLSDAIPGASGKLQEAMRANGAYTGNFRDAMAKGQITSEEFNQALMQLGMSDAAKKAANDTSQLGNASGNLEASVVKLGAGFIDLVKPQVTDWMAKLADKVSGLADNIPGLVSQAVQFAKQLGDIANNVAPVVIGITTLVGGITLLYSVMSAGGLLQWVSSLSVVTGVTQTWTGVTTIARNAQAAFNLVLETNPVMLVVVALAALTAGLAYFFTQTETGKRAWSSFTGFLSTSIANIRQWFGQAGDWIRSKWQGLMDWFGSVPGAISGFFSGIGDKLLAPFRWAVDHIKSLWNSTIGGFGFDLPDWIPGVGGQSFKIPMLASGGVIQRSGMALVGEAGPELLTLPRGAQVTPLNRASYSLTGANNNGGRALPVNVTINVEGVALDGYKTGQKLMKALEDYTKAHQ